MIGAVDASRAAIKQAASRLRAWFDVAPAPRQIF